MAGQTVIEAGSPVQYFHKIIEVWRYRDLLLMLCYRDIRVRYAQTYLGIAWAVINPVLSMLLLHFVFGVVAGIDTQGVPSMVYVMGGLLVWSYFSEAAGSAGQSVIGAQSLVKKVYFPRLVIPLSKTFSGLAELVVVLVILLIMMVFYGVPFSPRMMLVIPFLVLTVLCGFAVGIWIAALTIRFRDFSHIVPLMLRIGMFVSPIAYGISHVPEAWHWVISINPLTGIIEGIRWSLFDMPLHPGALWISVAMIFFLLTSGLWFFLRMEKFIADIL